MKIIDEKGKLFGKVNVIDILVILVIAAVVAVLAWKAGSKVGEAVGSNESKSVTLEYEVSVNAVSATICDNVEKIDFSDTTRSQIMNDGKLVDAHILSCARTPYYLTEAGEDGTLLRVEDPQRGVLSFKIRAQATLTDYAYGVGSQEVRVGKSYIVKTTELELTGTVTGVEVIDE